MIPTCHTCRVTLPHMDVAEYCSTASMVVIVWFHLLPVPCQRVNVTAVNSTTRHFDYLLLKKIVSVHIMVVYSTSLLIKKLCYNLYVSTSMFIPVHTEARLQRKSLILASYKYELEFRSTKHHIDIDVMSGLPVSTTFGHLLIH